ncbi:hypothetical protein ACQJBY_027064 [Aegilops geniculata]
MEISKAPSSSGLATLQSEGFLNVDFIKTLKANNTEVFLVSGGFRKQGYVSSHDLKAKIPLFFTLEHFKFNFVTEVSHSGQQRCI